MNKFSPLYLTMDPVIIHKQIFNTSNSKDLILIQIQEHDQYFAWFSWYNRESSISGNIDKVAEQILLLGFHIFSLSYSTKYPHTNCSISPDFTTISPSYENGTRSHEISQSSNTGLSRNAANASPESSLRADTNMKINCLGEVLQEYHDR